MSDEDLQLFRQETADVQPIRHSKLEILIRENRPTPGQIYRRHAAQRPVGRDDNCLTDDFVEMVDPEAVLSFKRDGIQHGVFRKLTRGEYAPDAVLDLHRMTVEQARREVFRFVGDCQRYDIRTALINHGKGGRSKGPPLIKSYIVKWLPMLPEVMAFHSAQRRHGGTGALYVLFRKSEHQKQLTRQRLGLGCMKPVP